MIFGDSIAFGSWDSQGGWADRLKRDYNKEYLEAAVSGNPNPHQILNLGIGGDTSRGVLKRFENEYLARQSASGQPVFVIAIGTNDGRHVVSADSVQVPAREYRDNLRRIAQLARTYSHTILLIGLFPLKDEGLRFKDYIYSQSTVRQYDAIIDEVSNEFSVPKVEIFHPVIERDDLAKLFFGDGLHPNDAGHQIIYENVKQQLQKVLGKNK